MIKFPSSNKWTKHFDVKNIPTTWSVFSSEVRQILRKTSCKCGDKNCHSAPKHGQDTWVPKDISVSTVAVLRSRKARSSSRRAACLVSSSSRVRKRAVGSYVVRRSEWQCCLMWAREGRYICSWTCRQKSGMTPGYPEVMTLQGEQESFKSSAACRVIEGSVEQGWGRNAQDRWTHGLQWWESCRFPRDFFFY